MLTRRPILSQGTTGVSAPDISPSTSYRLDNGNYTGGAKQSDHPALPQDHNQAQPAPRALPAPAPVGPSADTFRLGYESVPTRRCRNDGPGLAMTAYRPLTGWPVMTKTILLEAV